MENRKRSSTKLFHVNLWKDNPNGIYYIINMLSFKRKYRKLSDHELVLLYKNEKNMLAFSEIYNRYAHLVLGWSMKYLKHRENAEDLTANLFIQLPEKIQKHAIEALKPWLYRVTCNACLMELRKRNPKQIEIHSDLLGENEVDYNFAGEENLQRLEKAIQTLKPAQKESLTLFYIQDKSYEQVAEIMKINLKEVKSHLQNGKRNLKIKLQEYHEVE